MSAIVPNQSIPNNPFGIDGTLYLDNALISTSNLASSATVISNNILNTTINLSVYNTPSQAITSSSPYTTWGKTYTGFTDPAVSGTIGLWCSENPSDLSNSLLLGTTPTLNSGNGFSVFSTSTGLFPIPGTGFTDYNSTQCSSTIDTGTITSSLPLWTPSGQPTNSCIQGVCFDFLFADNNHIFDGITINVDITKYPNTPSTLFLFGQTNVTMPSMQVFTQIGKPKIVDFSATSSITLSFGNTSPFQVYRLVIPSISSTSSGVCCISSIQLYYDIAGIQFNSASYVRYAVKQEVQKTNYIATSASSSVSIGNSSQPLSLSYSSLLMNNKPPYLIFNLSANDTTTVSTSDQYTFVPPFSFKIQPMHLPRFWISSKDASNDIQCDVTVNGSTIFGTGTFFPGNPYPRILSNFYYSFTGNLINVPTTININDVVVFKVTSYSGSSAQGIKVMLYIA